MEKSLQYICQADEYKYNLTLHFKYILFQIQLSMKRNARIIIFKFQKGTKDLQKIRLRTSKI